MIKLYKFLFFLFCLQLSLQLSAQRVVLIEASEDPTAPADIFPEIMGDTTDSGDRVDNNTIYQLENGSVYIISGTIRNTADWPLHIEAADLDDVDMKPVITRIPNASGTYPNILRPEGDVTFKNLWIISAERGPGEQHQWGQFRISGDSSRVIIDNCIIEKDRGGFIQMRAAHCKVYITNSILRNGGNRRIFQGNGRGFDSRNFAQDSIVIRNTVIHNIIDRVFRSQGAVEPHKYIEFDHCTVFNHSGRHGAFQFGKALTVKVTNNLLINPLMAGTTPKWTDEQTQPDNEAHKVFTIDTLYDATNFDFASNNIFYTQDVLDFFESNDTVSRPAVYSDLILQKLGDGAESTFFDDPVELNSIPMSIFPYIQDLYADPTSEEMFDFVVEDIAVQGTALDFGNLFDFSTFDPCYSPDSPSATSDTKGGAVGAVYFCANLSEGMDQEEEVRYVLIEDNGDDFVPVDIFPVIMGDTSETGARVSNNTIYQLENGKVYIISGTIRNTGDWPLHIEAVDLDDVETKPVITRIPNASGTYPNILRPEGDVIFKNLWIISAERGPGEQHQWGQIRISGDSSRVIVDNCIIEKDRGGFIQMRASHCKVYITNCILRNGGNRRIFQGNGRGFDSRNFAQDSIVIRHTVIHNVIDRVFRSQGAVEPHKYVEFDHCTVFNHSGRHGAFQFGKALTVKVTNNLLINPIMAGTTPKWTDEQTQPDNEAHKLFTIDTLYDGTTFNFASNNIFYTQDVLDFFASNDTVSRPAVYSDLILQELGESAEDTYFEEEFTLTSVPMSIFPYVQDLYADPTSEEMFDFVVEDVAVQGTALDFGNLFDFSTFDPCYSSATISATADTEGGPIGAVGSCQLSTSVFNVEITDEMGLKVQPNPINESANFSYELKQDSRVRFGIYDITGRLINTLVDNNQYAGQHNIIWSPKSLKKGFYIARLQTNNGETSLKLIVQ